MKEIQLANNKGIALCDEEDYELLSSKKWHISHGYAAHKYWSKEKKVYFTIRMHNFLNPTWKLIKHINDNKLDNRRCNLRERERRFINSARPKTKGRACKYKGVSTSGKKFRVNIKENGKTNYLGTFETEMEAAIIYDRAARKIFGEFACCNFPD